jgi:hypothetical protein
MRRVPFFLGTALVCAVAAAMLRPDLWFLINTPTGGDMGAHVLGPATMRELLFEHGRITGWSHSWFAGFPIYYFYFPLPSLVIVLLDLVIPYGVAFKLVAVAGVIATPAGAVYLARALGLSRPAALITGASAGLVVFTESYTIYGGNIPSTMAGEFAFSWSFALGFFALGAISRAIEDRRKIPVAALLLGLTALAHILTTLMVVIASLAFFFRSKGTSTTVATWAWGFGVAAFWAFPLIVRIGFTADMGWSPLRRWDELFPTELWFLLPLAVVGMVLGFRKAFLAPIHLMVWVPAIYFWLVIRLPEWFPDVIGRGSWKLWNGRLIPYWYFGLLFFAGLGVAMLWERLAERLPDRLALTAPAGVIAVVLGIGAGIAQLNGHDRVEWIAGVAVGFAAIAIGLGWVKFPTNEVGPLILTTLVVLVSLSGVTFLAGWARWNFTGYEGKDSYPEYSAFMDTIAEYPDGRVHWEANSDLNQFGTTMALMLIPYWTEGTHTSTEGLFFESSISTPFHFINASETSTAPSNPIPGLPYRTADFERGLNHLQFFATDYYVAFTDGAKEQAPEAGFVLLEESGPFALYDVPGGEMVQIATHQPGVYVAPSTELLGQFVPLASEEENPGFTDFAVDWYADLGLQEQWVVDEGPEDWPRVTSLDEVAALPTIDGSGEVTDVRIEDERISFSTTAIGVPHLIKVSYFPNWTASGAEGPYYAAPSFLMVVPTEGDVVLEFSNSWVEWAGVAMTLVAIGGLVGVWFVRRRQDAS